MISCWLYSLLSIIYFWAFQLSCRGKNIRNASWRGLIKKVKWFHELYLHCTLSPTVPMHEKFNQQYMYLVVYLDMLRWNKILQLVKPR